MRPPSQLVVGERRVLGHHEDLVVEVLPVPCDDLLISERRRRGGLALGGPCEDINRGDGGGEQNQQRTVRHVTPPDARHYDSELERSGNSLPRFAPAGCWQSVISE